MWLLRSIRFWLAVVLVATLAAVLFAVSRPLFFRVLSILGIVMLVVSTLVMVLTFKKAKRVSIVALLISIAVSLASFLVYQAILPVRAAGSVMSLAMLGGAMLGTAWARTSEFFVEQGTIKSRGNAWYLAVWAIIFAITQGVTLATGRPPRVALLLLCLGTGLALGNGGTMALRAWRASRTVRT